MKTKTLLLFFYLFTLISYAQNDAIRINDNVGSGDVYWTANNTYYLDGNVFVNAGTTLYIEPGTVIKGSPGVGEESSFLCVARDGMIIAEGTPDAPIIFTFEADPLDGSVPLETNGQWGGLLILGNASLNSTPGESAIEGIPTREIRGLYGGTNDEDNSGILSYISIRHGGTEIGAGNEINGLTLGGVGSGTTINNIEVISNADDGIEFFGGTVSVQNALVYGCGDDSYDYDEGWRGQFNSNWVAVASSNAGDRGGEHDGGTDPETAQPYALPRIDNAIFIGKGDARALTFRDNAGGHYSNSIFFNYGKGVDIENLSDGEDSYSRFLSGDLTFTNNIVDVVSNAFVTSTGNDDLVNYFILNNNSTSSDHGLTWDNGFANLTGRANWASWTLAVTSGRILLNPLSLNTQEDIKINVLLYPNPIIEESITCLFGSYKEGTYTLINDLGQKICKGKFLGRNFEIKNIKLSGVYFLKLNFENYSINKMVIKK